jgi:hypothetical protein
MRNPLIYNGFCLLGSSGPFGPPSAPLRPLFTEGTED